MHQLRPSDTLNLVLVNLLRRSYFAASQVTSAADEEEEEEEHEVEINF